jgi:hypothetical protein
MVEKWALRVGFILTIVILLIVLLEIITGLIQQKESQCRVPNPTPTSYYGG